MRLGAASFSLELLCQPLGSCFEAKVPFGDILSFLVCRQNVAKFWLRFGRDVPGISSLSGQQQPLP